VCEIIHLLDIASGQAGTRTLAKKAFIAKAFHLIFEDFAAPEASAVEKYIDI
jgi:hypothetical protein